MKQKSALSSLAAALAISFAPANSALAADYTVSDADAAARIRVTPEVINPGLEPFTATTGGRLGHSFLRNGGSGFEPLEFRNKFQAIENAPDSIISDRIGLTNFDSYAEGMLDGAKVMVFRVTNGKMNLVREDTVAPGGHKASGWNSAHGSSRLVAPATTTFTGGLESWGRRDTPYWFSVAAVDRYGREGAAAPAVRIDRPAATGNVNTAKADDATVNVPRPPRNAPTGPAEIPAPSDFKATYDPALDQVVTSWSPVDDPDLIGYRVLRSDYDPARHAGYRLDLVGKAESPEQHIKTGDMIIVQKTMLETSRSRHLTKRLFDARGHDAFLPNLLSVHPDEDPSLTWTLQPHAPGSPVEGGARYFARIEVKGPREFAIQPYAYGPTTQDHWPQFKTDRDYVFEIWARSESGPTTATFQLTGFYAPDGPNSVPAATFQLTDQWQKFTHTFRVPAEYDSGTTIHQFKFAVNGPAVIDLDNLRLREAATPLGALTAEDEKMFKDARLGALRTHNFIKTGRATYSMAQLAGPAGTTNTSSGYVSGNTLGQTLSIMEKVAARPWLQIEMHMSPEEWQGFMEFMAAPYDPAAGDTPDTKPWAAESYAQGRKEPWTNAFDKIYLELSNETWNQLFAPWTFQNMPDSATGQDLDRGTVYGLFQEWFIDQLQKSPYWNPELAGKFEFVIGGWATQQDDRGYGQRAIAASPRSKHLTIAAYNGGWDEGEGPMTDSDAAIQRVLLHAPQVGEPRSRAFADFLASEKQAGRGNWVNGVYEAGPGYALSGLNNQAQMTREEVETQARAMKSLASGTATLDSFLEKAAHGFVLNNFFTIDRGRTHWFSHTDSKHGGHPHLPFATIQLFNHEAAGDMLKVENISGPAINAPAFKRRPAGNSLPLVTTYATRKGDRVNVFVLSRRLDKFPDAASDGFTPVSLELPFTSAQKVTLHRLAGDPRAHNLDSEEVKIEKVDVAGAIKAAPGGETLVFPVDDTTGADKRGLPPGSTFLYVFEGVR